MARPQVCWRLLRWIRKYLDLVPGRDALRLVRDHRGLSPEQQVELDAVSQQFLDYRTAKAAEDHQRVAEVRS